MSDVPTALFRAIAASHANLLHPPAVIGYACYADAAVCTLTAFVLCAIFHFAVARRFKRTYMALHVFANVVISALTLPGAVRALVHPENSTVIAAGATHPNMVYACWIYALHIYHPIMFKTGVMDWIHHVPVYILNTLTFSIPCGDFIHLQSLVMTGIPGGLDYLLQVLEGEGMLSRALYKELCSSINVWVRAPVGAISSYICFCGLYHGYAAATGWQAFVLAGLGLHALWNPPFFGRQAIEANVVDAINRHRLVGGELKLPAVRAACGKPSKATAATPPREEAYPVAAKHADLAGAAPPMPEKKKAM